MKINEIDIYGETSDLWVFYLSVIVTIMLHSFRLEHVERIPAYLGEFISSLMESNCDSPDNLDADCLFACEDLRVRTVRGTALDPPSLKADVILVKCGVGDDVSMTFNGHCTVNTSH